MMIMFEHLTIINQNAGNFNAREGDRLINSLRNNVEGETIITTCLSELENLILNYSNHSRKPTLLGIGGGDGTAAHTLSLVKEHWGKVPDIIAPFAYGTMNNWAIPFNLYDCQIDRLKMKTGLGKTKAIKLSEYITHQNQNGGEIITDNLALLKVNNQNGFNVGFGLIPKLVWSYYGRSNEEFLDLEQKIIMKEEGYNDFDKLYSCERKNNGLLGTVASAIKTFSNLIFHPKRSEEFYSKPLEGKFYVDGKRQFFPGEVTSIYMASYEQTNLGIKGFWPQLLPGARKHPDKMQILVSWNKPFETVTQLPKIFMGKELNKVAYFNATEFVYEPRETTVGQVDAEYIFGDGFRTSFDQNLNIISPYKKSA